MEKKFTTFPATELPFCAAQYIKEDMLLLDIETTGLSPAVNHIYCIGCSWIKDQEVTLVLIFAESPEEEPDILQEFCLIAANFRQVVTFNGQTFDLPFLKKRCQNSGMQDSLARMDSLDLYRLCRHMNNLLRLPGYKQKDIESFLGICREDLCTGRELIKVYKDYVRDRDPDRFSLLYTHNYEDVKGMYALLSMMSYRDFLSGSFSITQRIVEGEFLHLKAIPLHPLPQYVSYDADDICILMRPKEVLITMPVHHGFLRHYFPDPKNYCYLPLEHKVIHKDIGQYVDPDCRRPATREECFVSSQFDYLKLPGKKADSYLRESLTDTCRYLELSKAMSDDPENLKDFLQPFLNGLFQKHIGSL